MTTASTPYTNTETSSHVPESVKTKFKNVEILRFFLAWAVVGFHIVLHGEFDKYGLGSLKSYLICGEYAVRCFFVLAFYFLIRGRSIQQPILTFVCSKWMRLAPLIIVVTLFGYILHLCGYWGWNWAANIEQWLLIHDWAARYRWEQFVYPAWWCSAYMLVSVVYIAVVRAFPGRYIPFILGISAILGWRTEICTPEYSVFETVLALGRSSVAFFYLGIGALVVYIIRCTEKRSRPKPDDKFVTWGYTAAEAVLMGALLLRLFAAQYIAFLNPLLATLCFSVLLVLFILKRGYLSRLLETDISSFLGRYAYALFVVHPLVLGIAHAVILPYFGAEATAHPRMVLSGIACTTMLLAMVGYHCVERPILRLYAKRKRKDAES